MKYSLEQEAKDLTELCNENLYLFCSNPKLMKKINFYKNHYYKSSVINQTVFKNSLENYNNMILQASKLVKELGISNNSISYFISISNLIKEGCFSKDSIISNKEENYKDLVGLLSLNIINGYGCCRHYTSFVKDIFNKLKLMGDPISCVGGKSLTLNEAFTKEVHHELNLIEYNGVYYGADSYNADVCRFIDGFTMESYSFDGYFYYIKPAITVISNNESYSEIISKIKLLNEASKKEPMTYNQLIEIFEETKIIYNKNLTLIEDFKKETAELKRNIITEASKLW